MIQKRWTAALVLALCLSGIGIARVQGQDLQTLLSYFLRDLYAGNVGTSFSTGFTVKDGTAAAPSITFGSQPALGFYRSGTDLINIVGSYSSSIPAFTVYNGGSPVFVLASGGCVAWSSTTSSLGAGDTSLCRGAAGAVKFTATGTNVPMQLRGTQGTAPTCSSNCGTSPSVAGTDTAGIVTMGASGVPASGWVVTFNGTWAAAPACTVTAALAGMAAGKSAIVVATTTTTITVTTNGTAPATSDKYAYQCFGVS